MMDSLPPPRPEPAPSASRDPAMDRWIHPSVILVATDLRDLDRLTPFAFDQAERTGARLLLLHVLAATASLSADGAGMPYYDPSGALEFAAKELETWCESARQKNILCDGLVREGNPAQQIGAVARQFQADRVLMGTRSRGKLGKLLLGSVAEQVLRSVNLPVMTVGPEAHLAVERSRLQAIVLHATTLRETSRPSAALACQIASSQGEGLLLLHVLPPLPLPRTALPFLPLPNLSIAELPLAAEAWEAKQAHQTQPASMDESAVHELRRLAEDTGAACGCQIETRVVHGNPSIEILAEASERQASLIVLGARHRSVFENLARDRTIYRVLAHARCPVLTLREQQPAPVAPRTPQMASRI